MVGEGRGGLIASPLIHPPLQARTPSKEEMETWANDLVGRWWEVFWDPEPSSLEKTANGGAALNIVDLTHEEVGGDMEGAVPAPHPCDHGVSMTISSVHRCSGQLEVQQQIQQQHPQYQQQQQQQMVLQQSMMNNRIQLSPAALPPMMASVGGLLPAVSQQYLQHNPPQQQYPQLALPKQLSQPTTTNQNTRQLQEFNIVFTTATLGLAMVLVNETQITVREIKSQQPDVAAILRPNDVLVGVNGKKFEELFGYRIEGTEAFQAVINFLKVQKRPMLVMFERFVTATGTAAVAVGGGDTKDKGEDVDDIPLNQLNQHKLLKRMNDSNCDINQGVAAAATDNDSADDDDDNTETDDIDWYDARVMSYNAKYNKFTVYFLGSEKAVSYEMTLSSKVVRPSVRAWTRRTLALLFLGEKVSVLGESKCDDNRDAVENIEHCLPPSTERREDSQQLENISQSEHNRYNTDRTNHAVRQILEYKILLAKQQYLATHLSPHVDEDEEDDDENEGGFDGPGPPADSNYVKHLCNCMNEAEKTCDWLIGESVVLDVLCEMIVTDESSWSAVATTTKSTRDNILSFLVNGARFVKRMLSFEPRNNALHSIPTQRGRGRRGRKKRRVESTTINASGSEGCVIVDEVFNAMLSKALLSNESLSTMLNQLLNESALSNQVWISTTLTKSLSRLFRELWEPITSWINKSEDMISGTSGQFYAFEDIERHVQLSQMKGTKLALIDLSEWTTALLAKLRRAHLFEMEVWSAIRACTQPVVMVLNMAGPTVCDDDCLLALKRLKDEATCDAPHLPRDVESDPIMRNLNPLGRCTIDSSTGLTFPSSLNRGVINDAIAVRRWILDFNQAKNVRERTGFVQDVIERYVVLPQLPTPPSGGLDGMAANPSAILAANTKDSITLLSSHCYSYNHIIGNAAARLQKSMRGNDFLDAHLRKKEGVMLALSELTRLPVLSIVEEKLHLREELVDWDAEAQQMMVLSTQSKLSFGQVDALNQKLSLILTLKSDRRAKVCKHLNQCGLVEEEIKAFAVADEKVVCAVTGAWVRDHYTRALEWKSNYCSMIAILKSNDISNDNIIAKSHGESVVVDRITAMLTAHDTLAVAFSEEYSQLESVRQNVTAWANTIKHIVLSDSFTLEERCQQLSNASNLRPKGVLLDPARGLIDLWIRAFTWRVQLKNGVRTMFDQFDNLPKSPIKCPDYETLKTLVCSTIAPLIIEDFIFPDEFALNPFLTHLRDKIFRSIQGPTSTIRKDIESGIYGKHVIDLILNAEADKVLGSCLSITRRVFWLMILQCFFACLESDDFGGGLSDAKVLLSLSYQFIHISSFMDTKEEENRLQLLIGNAENLETISFQILEQCTALLQTNCCSHKEELRLILLGLSDVQSSLDNVQLAPAVRLLRDKTLKEKVNMKMKELTWLLGTFAYDLLYQNADAHASKLCDRIHINNLRDLCDSCPVSICPQWKVTMKFGSAIVRASVMVKDLWDQANAWQSKVLLLIPTSHVPGPKNESRDVVKLDTLIAMAEDQILSKVIMPELEMVQNVTAVACQVRARLDKELFSEEYMGAVDVSQACPPNRKSLIETNGDFVLYRFTGSEMYGALRRTLFSILETAAQLPVRTSEKATLEWMISIFDWVESIHPVEDFHLQLVIKIEHSLEILEQGHKILYSVSDDVQSYLRGVKAGLQVLPQNFNVVVMSGGVYTLGIGLLRWATLLFECLKSDVDKEDRWKELALEATDLFLKFDSESIGGAHTSFRDATSFRDKVESLICESSNLIIQDDEVMHSLSLLSQRMKANLFFQKSLEVERAAVEEKKLLFEESKFTNPRNLVNDRYELLNSLMGRLASLPYEADDSLLQHVDSDSLIVGEPSVRDKSRVFLEKSFWTGMETLGFDPKDTDNQDFCSILAWRLEEAVYEKYHPHDLSDLVSNDYKDKVRSLRFNLQDPKNPMLCARVLAGEMPLDELVLASTEALASNELKLKRRKVEEEAIKNVVLAADSEKKDQFISNELAAKIRIESTTMKRSNTPEAVPSALMADESPLREDIDGILSKISSPSAWLATKEANQIVASLPPPPMRVKREPNEPIGSAFGSTYDQVDPPPPPSLLVATQNNFHAGKSPAHHIISQSGTDLFQISISKLKISFTTKIAADLTCRLEADRLFPSILVEKGRLSVDEFNKFIHSKTKGGRWKIAHLKLSSITGESNMKSYKSFYKEYESLGRLAMIQVSDSTKIFLVTPKFQRLCKCLNNIENLSKSSTYVVVLTNEIPSQKRHFDDDDDSHIDDDMF